MFSDTETLQQNDVVTTIPPTPLLMPRSHPIPPLLMPFHQRTRILCSVDWKKRYFKRKGGKYCHSRWWMAPKTRGKACGKLWCDSNKISLVCSPKRLLLIISETLSVRTRYYLWYPFLLSGRKACSIYGAAVNQITCVVKIYMVNNLASLSNWTYIQGYAGIEQVHSCRVGVLDRGERKWDNGQTWIKWERLGPRYLILYILKQL